jgi:hypothetical protein
MTMASATVVRTSDRPGPDAGLARPGHLPFMSHLASGP